MQNLIFFLKKKKGKKTKSMRLLTSFLFQPSTVVCRLNFFFLFLPSVLRRIVKRRDASDRYEMLYRIIKKSFYYAQYCPKAKRKERPFHDFSERLCQCCYFCPRCRFSFAVFFPGKSSISFFFSNRKSTTNKRFFFLLKTERTI